MYMSEISLFFISSVFILAYLCISIWVSRGIPVSISSTYYLLGNKGWLFQLFLSITACSLYATWINVVYDDLQFIPFISCAMLLFVALAPRTKYQLEGKVHNVCAIVCAVLAVIWQLIEGDWSFTIFCLFVSSMLSLRYPDKWCWWFEVGILISLLVNLTLSM